MNKNFQNLTQAFNKLKLLEKSEIINSKGISDLSLDRKELLYTFIKSNEILNFIDVDIAAYAVKALRTDEYASCFISEHNYSNQEWFEYDPPKNGQNIIKHGLSFTEIVDLSEGHFGSLLVYLPKKQDCDEGRKVIFSGIKVDKLHNKVSFPFNIENGYSTTMSIVTKRNKNRPGYRFISSRLMSKDDYQSNIKQAFGKIIENPNNRMQFIDECVKYVEKHLFFK